MTHTTAPADPTVDPIDRAEIAIWHAFHDASWFLAVGVSLDPITKMRVLRVYTRTAVPVGVVWPHGIVPIILGP